MSLAKNNRGSLSMFMGLLSLVITLAIICFLFKIMLKAYFKPVSTDTKEEKQALSDQGIDISNYKSIIDTTKDKLKTISSQQNTRMNNLTNLGN
jgi:hypothetical protein